MCEAPESALPMEVTRRSATRRPEGEPLSARERDKAEDERRVWGHAYTEGVPEEIAAPRIDVRHRVHSKPEVSVARLLPRAARVSRQQS